MSHTSNHFDSRHYVVFNVSELNKIDFNQVFETSSETVRLSVDGTKTFIKYDGNMPSSVSTLTTKEGPYSHEEILTILAGSDWTDPNMEIV